MKKLYLSLLLVNSLLFSTNHFGVYLKGKDLRSDSKREFIYRSLMHIAKNNIKLYYELNPHEFGSEIDDSLMNRSISLPDQIDKTSINASISVTDTKGKVVISVPFKCTTYDKLSTFEQEIVNYFNFDKDKPITIIGLHAGDTNKFNGIDYGSQPLNGSITVGSKTKHLTWQETSQTFRVSDENRFDLTECLWAKAKVSKQGPSPKVIHKYWGF